NGQAHSCRASIGVALFPEHRTDADGLYKNADLALYEAKVAGGGTRYFKSSMRASLQARMSELSLARHALDGDQVLPFYQPKVDLGSGIIKGFEALLRWRDPKHAIHAPGMIPAAFEDAELAIALDERMFERIAHDITKWNRLGLPIGRIAFNVSGATFRQEDFAANLLARTERACIPASCLELEVTETVLLERTSHNVTETFERLRHVGMTIALDDFGTGYASLIHLKQFPVDVLKIDCSFIRSLDPSNAAIVRAIVNLGRDLGITTVAEGIETDAQADRLHREGCDQAQGYLFSPAVAAEQVPALLANLHGPVGPKLRFWPC
ncbi:bifunctional diguanylate cyclase/phosphodiesterase, partial [Novosphingobium sp. ST904]